MDKYQRLAFGLVLLVTIVCYVSVALVLRFSFALNIGIVCSLLLLGWIVFKLNCWMKPHLNPNDYPNNDWYRTHLERNFDAVVLGDEIDALYFDKTQYKDQKVLYLFQKNQNIETSLFVFKAVFSILRPGGSVIIPLREGGLKYMNTGIYDERCYYWAVSAYAFGAGKISCLMKKVYTRIPVLLFRWKDFRYLCKKLIWRNIDQIDIAKKIKQEEQWLHDQNQASLKKLDLQQAKILDEFRSFCLNRDLCLITTKYNCL